MIYFGRVLINHYFPTPFFFFFLKLRFWKISIFASVICQWIGDRHFGIIQLYQILERPQHSATIHANSSQKCASIDFIPSPENKNLFPAFPKNGMAMAYRSVYTDEFSLDFKQFLIFLWESKVSRRTTRSAREKCFSRGDATRALRQFRACSQYFTLRKLRDCS